MIRFQQAKNSKRKKSKSEGKREEYQGVKMNEKDF